jgi:hypothetical protein
MAIVLQLLRPFILMLGYCYYFHNSADYMQALQMKFTSKEDAMAFADKQGMALKRQQHGQLKTLMYCRLLLRLDQRVAVET